MSAEEVTAALEALFFFSLVKRSPNIKFWSPISKHGSSMRDTSFTLHVNVIPLRYTADHFENGRSAMSSAIVFKSSYI